MADESREIRKNRAIRRLRWLILAATLVAVAGTVGLFLAGRSAPPVPSEDEREAERMEPSGELVTVGEGFERTFSEGERQVFTLRGERYAVDREGVVFLEGVEVIVARDEGSHYEIEAAQARFDVEKREGRLAGGVRLAVPGELELTAPHLEITHRGSQARTRAPVEFKLGDTYRGRASEGLRALLVPRRFLLEGHVRVTTLPGAAAPLSLDAQGMVLDRGRNLVRSQGWAVLRRRGERVSALGMEVFFAEDESTPRVVRAEGKVQGFFRRGPGGSLEDVGADSPEVRDGDPGPEPEIRRLSFRAQKLSLRLTEAGQPERLDLERGVRGRAVLRALGPAEAPRYRLAAPYVSASFVDGEPSAAEATGGVELVMDEPPEAVDAEDQEGAGGAATGGRRATAKRGEAHFDAAGELTTFVLEQDVVLEDGEVEASGDRGVFRVVEETGELVGRPAVAVSERGRMEAPRILYTRGGGLVHGTGGVRVRLSQTGSSALSASPLGRGEGPIWVQADEGYLRDEPRGFLFVGDVRAWRGEDLLVAAELRGDEPEDRLTATGGVRTLFTPEDTDDGEGGRSAPIEVESRDLVYRGTERILVYTGDVVAEQEERTVACAELVVELADAGGMKRLVCSGGARVEDPDQGRTLDGERAIYEPGDRTIEVIAAEGGKVTMKDRDGNVIEGPRMEYDIDNDRVRVLGRKSGPAAPPTAGPSEAGPGAW